MLWATCLLVSYKCEITVRYRRSPLCLNMAYVNVNTRQLMWKREVLLGRLEVTFYNCKVFLIAKLLYWPNCLVQLKYVLDLFHYGYVWFIWQLEKVNFEWQHASLSFVYIFLSPDEKRLQDLCILCCTNAHFNVAFMANVWIR